MKTEVRLYEIFLVNVLTIHANSSHSS